MDHAVRFGSASLAQVAELLGQNEEQVLAEAAALLGEGIADRGRLAPDAVSALIASVEPRRPVSDAEPLILAAFQQAEDKSKVEWTSMAVPVLKNRLLQLTSRNFREDEYGSPNIWHFVTLFPALLATEGEYPRERVRLLTRARLQSADVGEPASLDPAGLGRIRSDLWRAVVDYRSQEVYVWDETTGRARVRKAQDAEHLPVLPTLSAEDMGRLRREFVDTQERVSDQDAKRLEEWTTRAGPTIALPRMYRGLWNALVKSHVADMLRSFFLGKGLDVPGDMLVRASSALEPDREVERLRKLVHHYVDAMTAEELGRLSIEMAVVLRVPVRTEV